MDNIRAKVKRRFSHKDPEPNLDDDYSSADEETNTHINKEVDDAEKDGDKYPMGRPNSFLNRMISHGNKKTEDEIAAEAAAAEARNNGSKMTVVGSTGQTAGAAQGSSSIGGARP